MKISLSIELDIPEDIGLSDWSYNEIRQLLYDSYVNYTTCQHLQESVQWCARARLGSENEDITGKQLYNYHNKWAHICKAAKWDYEIKKST